MKKYNHYFTLCLAMLFAFIQMTFAQHNNIDIFQGGVNGATFETSGSEAYVDQTDESGTVWSRTVIQQLGESQYAEVEQSNVDHGTVSTFQQGGDNEVNIAQLDGELLFLGARQWGNENVVNSGQTGMENTAITLQIGDGNTTLVGQSGNNNKTASYSELNVMHLAFLEQSDPAMNFSHDFDGNGKTDGIVQWGDGNMASLSQSGNNNGAFIYQEGDTNDAAISQAGSFDKACILQRGFNNIAQTNQ